MLMALHTYIHSFMSTEQFIKSSQEEKKFQFIFHQSRKRIIKYCVWIFVGSVALFFMYGLVWLAFQSDVYTEHLMNSVPICPCRMSTTWKNNQFDFTIDSICDPRKSNFWNCRFHQGAKGCYRKKSISISAGAQCCYDRDGLWLSNWRKGAGTLDFYYPETGRNLSTYQHFFSDVLSYFSCCNHISDIFNTCKQYMRYRPAGTCE